MHRSQQNTDQSQDLQQPINQIGRVKLQEEKATVCQQLSHSINTLVQIVHLLGKKQVSIVLFFYLSTRIPVRKT